MPKFPTFVVMAMTMLAIPPIQAQVIFDNGISNVVDTTINDYIEVYNSLGGDPTTVTFNTGADVTGDLFDETVAGFENSIIIINDGSFAQDIASYDSTTVSIFGGNLNDDLSAFDDSIVNFSGGTLADDVQAFGSSTVNLMGGSYGEDIESIGGTIDISGGVISANGTGGAIRTDEDGTIILQGTSFTVNGSSFNTSGQVSDVDGTISGTLAGGTTFSDVAFDRDPSGDGFDFGILEIIIIPEPTSLTLLSFGGLALWMRRRSVCQRK